jgi:hypothetical protein
MVRRAAVVLALLALPRLALAQQPRPAFSVQPGGVVAASLPSAVLSDSDVRKRLASGLTTTFIAVARNRASDSLSGARLEVRYDLWDEVWIVRRVEFDRRTDQQRIASMDALEKWWKVPLRLLASSQPRVAIELELTVLPFSSAESDDARQWISKSGGVGTSSGGSGFVDALIGTTISAKPITSYRWNAEVVLR